MEQNEESVRSSTPWSDMMTAGEDDCFVHKTYDLSHAKCA